MERIGGEIRREAARLGPAGGMADLVDAWPAAVGDANARKAWPARLGRDGTLYVHTEDSVWAFELSHHAVEIAERLGVERIRFAPGPLPEPLAEPEETLPVAPIPTREHLERAAELTAAIGDEELREAVARAAAASLARAAADP